MKRIFLFLFCLCISSSSFAGEIFGRLYFEKAGSKTPLANARIRIHVYKDDYEFSGAELKTDTAGKFRFPNLESGERYAYIVYPIYDGINYPYEEIHLEKSSEKMNKDFTIQEPTGSVKDLAVNESIFFEVGQKDIWKIRHEITIENKGDQLYHPDAPGAEPIRFSLFQGGFDLAMLEGVSRENSKIDEKEDILEVYLTLAPHQSTTMKFSYYYLPESRHITFERPAFLSRSNMNLFFRTNLRVFSSQFKFDPMLGMTNPEYKFAFSSGPIEQNQKIQFDVRGFYMQRDYLRGLVLLACLAFLVGIAYFVIRESKTVVVRKKEVNDRVYRYLSELRAKLGRGDMTEKEFKKENDRALNYLYYNSRDRSHE